MKTFLETFSLANHADVAESILGLANDFQPGEDGWVQIAPYGDYPHQGRIGKNGKRLDPEGCLQRLDAKSGEAMANEFNSILSKASRVVFGGRPWYRGHHDIDPIKYPDPNAYGWIMKLANRDDGVYALVDWTPEGKKLIEDKSFKFFSPYWDVQDTKAKDDNGRKIVAPIRLNSVGFTNKPNIPVMPLANEEEAKPTQPGIAETLVSSYINLGVLTEADREEWIGFCNESFEDAAWALANGGTSAGAKKGWETRRANAGAAAAKMPKAAARTAAKTARISARDKHQAAIDEYNRKGKFTSLEHQQAYKKAQAYFRAQSRKAGRAKAKNFRDMSEADKNRTMAEQEARYRAGEAAHSPAVKAKTESLATSEPHLSPSQSPATRAGRATVSPEEHEQMQKMARASVTPPPLPKQSTPPPLPKPKEIAARREANVTGDAIKSGRESGNIATKVPLAPAAARVAAKTRHGFLHDIIQAFKNPHLHDGGAA